jgi:isoamylase
VPALRARQRRNFLVTLLLSQGTPMLSHGDELGRTQQGNNNAWCQDNEISWFDWEAADGELLEFARRVIALRREHPAFRRTSFLSGKAGESGLPDAWWFRPDGRRMTQRDWTSETRTLGVFLNGREIRERTPHSEPIFDDSFLLIFNAHSEPVVFTLPTRRFGSRWQVELATGDAPEGALGARALVAVQEHSLVLLRRV